MKKLHALALLLAGIVIGCGAATSVSNSFASGKWRCAEADSNRPRTDIMYTMNALAPSQAAGSLLEIDGVVCVKF